LVLYIFILPPLPLISLFVLIVWMWHSRLCILTTVFPTESSRWRLHHGAGCVLWEDKVGNESNGWRGNIS